MGPDVNPSSGQPRWPHVGASRRGSRQSVPPRRARARRHSPAQLLQKRLATVDPEAHRERGRPVGVTGTRGDGVDACVEEVGEGKTFLGRMLPVDHTQAVLVVDEHVREGEVPVAGDERAAPALCPLAE